jgi:hypothetical protein
MPSVTIVFVWSSFVRWVLVIVKTLATRSPSATVSRSVKRRSGASRRSVAINLQNASGPRTPSGARGPRRRHTGNRISSSVERSLSFGRSKQRPTKRRFASGSRSILTSSGSFRYASPQPSGRRASTAGETFVSSSDGIPGDYECRRRRRRRCQSGHSDAPSTPKRSQLGLKGIGFAMQQTTRNRRSRAALRSLSSSLVLSRSHALAALQAGGHRFDPGALHAFTKPFRFRFRRVGSASKQVSRPRPPPRGLLSSRCRRPGAPVPRRRARRRRQGTRSRPQRRSHPR